MSMDTTPALTEPNPLDCWLLGRHAYETLQGMRTLIETVNLQREAYGYPLMSPEPSDQWWEVAEAEALRLIAADRAPTATQVVNVVAHRLFVALPPR